MSPHLPSQIVDRTANPSANHALVQAIAAESGRNDIDNWNVVKRGWVRADELRRMHARMETLYASGDRAYGQPAWILWSVLAASLWLDAVTAARSRPGMV
jgi:hypothetical protein